MEIASLIVRIGADMADLVSESKKATQVMTGMASTIKTIGTLMMVQFGQQAVAAVASMVRGIVDWANALGNLSQQTGISTDALQLLEYAGKATGVTIEQITRGIDTMVVRLAKGQPSAVSAVSELGLNFRALSRDAPEDQLYKVADAFQAVADPVERLRIAVGLFGPELGPKLLPMIANLRSLAQEARDLGLVLGPEQVQTFRQLGDAWDKLALAGQVFVAQVIVPLVPKVVEAVNEFVRLKKGLDDVAQGIRDFDAQSKENAKNMYGIDLDALDRGKAKIDEMTQAWVNSKREALGLAKIDFHPELAKAAADVMLIGEHLKDAHSGMEVMTESMRKNSMFAKAWADEGRRIEQYMTAVSGIRNQLSGKDMTTEVNQIVDALQKIGTTTPIVASAAQKFAEQLKEDLRQMKLMHLEATSTFEEATAAYRRLAGQTKDGLLTSRAGGTTAGALGILPGKGEAGDPVLREQISLLDALGASSEAVATTYDAMGQVIAEGNYTIIGSLDATKVALSGVEQGWRGAAGAIGGYKAALGEAFSWAEAGGGFVYDTGSQASVDILNRMNDAILSTKYGAAWKGAGSMRGFAGGTDGYEYFGGGTPAMLHGWEKVTPKGQGGGDGATVVTVNMSGMLLSNSPAAREEIRRFINDTVASGIKRSRKFSY